MRFEQLNAQLTQLRAQRMQEEPIIEELQAENEKMQNQIRSLNHEQSNLKTKIHDMKQDRQEVSDKRDHDQFAIVNLRAEISKLQSLVVRSPERVKKEISEMSRVHQADNITLREMDDKLKALQTKVDGLNKTEKVLPLSPQNALECALFLPLFISLHFHPRVATPLNGLAHVWLNASSFDRTCQSSSSSSRRLRNTWASSRVLQRK
jgi:predicted nuclease with TOPRIM domain